LVAKLLARSSKKSLFEDATGKSKTVSSLLNVYHRIAA